MAVKRRRAAMFARPMKAAKAEIARLTRARRPPQHLPWRPGAGGRPRPLLAVFAVFCSEISVIALPRSGIRRRLSALPGAIMKREHYGNFSVACTATSHAADVVPSIRARRRRPRPKSSWRFSAANTARYAPGEFAAALRYFCRESSGEERAMTDTATMVALGEDYPELREAARKICERYPGSYWRKLEADQAYPTEFIPELTRGGFLASLIPEEYGGSGLPLRAAAVILEEINASGCTASQGHAQMYIMGTVLRHGSAEQKERYLPKIASGELRLQAFGVTEPTTGSDTTKLKTRAVRAGNDHHLVSGQKVWTSRARHSDLMLLLARTTP